MKGERAVGVLWFVLLGLPVAACAPPTTAVPTRLGITTIQTVCGGAFDPEQPPCRSDPISRSVEVTLGRTVVAAGTTDTTGHVVLEVPPGDLVVSVPDALPYMNCETPSVSAHVGTTTPVTQTCTLLLP